MSFPQDHNQRTAVTQTATDNDGIKQTWTRRKWANYATAEAAKKGWTNKQGKPLVVTQDAIRQRFRNQDHRGYTDRQCLFLDELTPYKHRMRKREKGNLPIDEQFKNDLNKAMLEFSAKRLVA